MDDNVKKLIEALTSMTQKKYLKWERIALAGHYMTTIGDNVIYVGQADDSTINFVINNDKGESVISLEIRPNEVFYEVLKQLIQAIQISDSNSKEIINKILESIGEKDKEIIN